MKQITADEFVIIKAQFENLLRDPAYKRYEELLDTKIKTIEEDILSTDAPELTDETIINRLRELIAMRKAFKFALGISTLVASTKTNNTLSDKLAELDPYETLDEIRGKSIK